MIKEEYYVLLLFLHEGGMSGHHGEEMRCYFNFFMHAIERKREPMKSKGALLGGVGLGN